MNSAAMLDPTSHRSSVSWWAVLPLGIWCAVEAAVLAYMLHPTMSELITDLTGFQVPTVALVLILSIFLTIVIAGSFACLQVLNDAIKQRQIAIAVQMILVQLSVAAFEVVFLYRGLVDAITPWMAQQGVELGVLARNGLTLLGFVAVRGMTWFLFGRSGASALVPLLGRPRTVTEEVAR